MAKINFPEVPEQIPVEVGPCEGPLRQYFIKRLDEANVRRSLAGALKRCANWPVVMISTKSGTKLPEELETLYNGKDTDWSLFEGYSRGVTMDGFLECFVDEKDKFGVLHQVLVRLSTIDRCDVSYCEKCALLGHVEAVR